MPARRLSGSSAFGRRASRGVAASRHCGERRRRRAGVKVVSELDRLGLDWLVTRRAAAEELEHSDPRAVRDGVGRAVTELIRVSSRG